MRTIDQLIGDAPIFEGMDRERVDLIAGCASNQVFKGGEYLLREGEPAEHFFIVRDGAVALEVFAPRSGAMTIETIHAGEVLGWSWLVAPYRTDLDARAMGTTRTIAFDGACLRGKCEQDHDLGYDLMQRFSAIIAERLQATRFRLLDVYGHAGG